MSHEFDPTLSSVLRATKSAGLVAERFASMPGFEHAGVDSNKGTKDVELQIVDSKPAAGASAASKEKVYVRMGPRHERTRVPSPGSVLCVSNAGTIDKVERTKMLLLLVPETPTWGVDQERSPPRSNWSLNTGESTADAKIAPGAFPRVSPSASSARITPGRSVRWRDCCEGTRKPLRRNPTNRVSWSTTVLPRRLIQPHGTRSKTRIRSFSGRLFTVARRSSRLWRHTRSRTRMISRAGGIEYRVRCAAK